MGKYDGYLICTDFDGTLAKEAKISEENRAAIREFMEGGGLFTIASGRSPDFLIEKTADLPVNAPLLALNGGAITDPRTGEILRRATLDDGAVTALNTIVRMIPTIDGVHLIYRDGENFDILRLTAGVDLCTEAILSGTGRELYKFLLVFKEPEHTLAAEQACKALFGSKYVFERSWPHGLEMIPPDGGKGNGVRALRELCGDKVRCIIGAGDYENDISLIEAADIGCAVANAIDAVKAAADRVTQADCGAAIAEIIHSLPTL